jgi:copper resistance protein B
MTSARTKVFTSLAASLLLLPAAAFAQHAGHPPAVQGTAAPQGTASQQGTNPPTDAAGNGGGHARHDRTRPSGAPQPRKQAQPPMDHDAMPMDHGSMSHDANDQPAARKPDHARMDPAGMDHGSMDHGSMDHGGSASQPRTPIPPLTDADRAAAVPPPGGHPVHDNAIFSYVLFNRLEAWDADPDTALSWEGQAWIGTDLNRVWLRSEGERTAGRLESADLEVLYGRSVARWWDVVAGVRHDFQPGGSQDFAAIGVVGLAPYKFEVAATAYLGESGQSAARIEVESETLLTNRLILQPLVEINAYGKDDARRGIGSGWSTAEAGLRLRYEVTRRFAPYIGIVRERAFGHTADFRQAEGDPINDTRFVAGVRTWF